MSCRQSKHTVFTAQHLLSRMPIKHPNDGVFILMVYCFSPTHLKYFTIHLILAVSKPILREVYWELATEAVSWPQARCFSGMGPACLIRLVSTDCSKQDSKFDWKKYHSGASYSNIAKYSLPIFFKEFLWRKNIYVRQDTHNRVAMQRMYMKMQTQFGLLTKLEVNKSK